MAKVTIIIDATAVDDRYGRFHGKAIDGTLNKDFWTTQPDKVIGTRSRSFHHEETVELKAGRHSIEYGVSCYVGKWTAKITANGKEIASGDVTVDKHLGGSFLLSPGLLIPIVVPLQTPILKIKILNFPPLLRAPFSARSQSNPCPFNIGVSLPTGQPASYATVDLFRVDKFLWWEYDTFFEKRMTDWTGKVVFPNVTVGRKYHIRAYHGTRKGDAWTTIPYCNQSIYLTLP